MTVEETLTACLRTTSLGNAVYPDAAPDSATAPYVVYTQFAGTRMQDLQGQSNLANPKFQIDLYAATKSQAVALKNEIRTAVLASASLNAFFMNEGSFYESETKLHRHRQDFSFWYQD